MLITGALLSIVFFVYLSRGELRGFSPLLRGALGVLRAILCILVWILIAQPRAVTTDEEISAGDTHNPSGVPASARLHAFLNSKSPVRKALVAPLKLILSDTQRHALWARLRDRNIQRGKRHEMDGLSRQLLEGALVQERTAMKRLNNYLEQGNPA